MVIRKKQRKDKCMECVKLEKRVGELTSVNALLRDNQISDREYNWKKKFDHAESELRKAVRQVKHAETAVDGLVQENVQLREENGRLKSDVIRLKNLSGYQDTEQYRLDEEQRDRYGRRDLTEG